MHPIAGALAPGTSPPSLHQPIRIKTLARICVGSTTPSPPLASKPADMKLYSVAALVLAAFLTPALHAADAARFDLVGPKIDIRITRGGTTLPIAQVPSLQAGDKIWIKADLPSTQSNHLLIVVAFLRGTTNEPPDNWFTEIDTWDKKTIEGTSVTVPEGAEQALMFVAPQVGGDFKT